MYFSIIRKACLALALTVLFTSRSYAAATVVFFDGAESGDTSGANVSGLLFDTVAGSTTPSSFTADSGFANSGAYSYKFTTTVTNTSNIGFGISIGTASPSAVMDVYYKPDSLPNSIGAGTFLLMHFDPAAGNAISSVYLQTNGIGNIALQLTNESSGSIVTVATSSFGIMTQGNVYRLVYATTAATSGGALSLLVCTVPGNVCTTVFSSTTLNTGANNPDVAYLFGRSNVTSIGPFTEHWDDELIETGTTVDPGPHEVLARQFTAAGTYIGWAPSGGGGCPGNWNVTPYPNSGPICINSTAGLSTCAAGASACQTGITHFDFNTGTGSTGHGTQLISTTQTINAVKIGAFGFTNSDNTIDSLVFIDSGGTETDVALGSSFGGAGATYREVYLASAPTATQLIGAQAGVKHAPSSTVQHNLDAAWLMADVALPASVGQGNVIILGAPSTSGDRLLALDLGLQP